MLFYNSVYPNFVWFWKLGCSRSNFKEVWYSKNLSIKFIWIFPSYSLQVNKQKSGLKTGVHQVILQKSKDKKKCITKTERQRLFCLHFLFWIYGFYRVKTDVHNRYIFNFVFHTFFEQDHLLNLFILLVYAKRWPKYARISKQKLRTITYEGYKWEKM